MNPVQTDFAPLIGLIAFRATHAADMLSLGFVKPEDRNSREAETWFLHVQCCWRIEDGGSIVTGRSDRWETEDNADPPEDWDPSMGGSLQSAKLREMFGDIESTGRMPIRNCTEQFVVKDVTLSPLGDLDVYLTANHRFRIFPDGSVGEFWRFFKRGDEGSHSVWGGIRSLLVS